MLQCEQMAFFVNRAFGGVKIIGLFFEMEKVSWFYMPFIGLALTGNSSTLCPICFRRKSILFDGTAGRGAECSKIKACK